MLVDLYPRHVIEFLGVHGVLAVPDAVAQLAREHSNVSILFMDIVGFTPLAKSVHPQEVMHMLNELFSEFDALCNEFGVYKVNDDYILFTVPNCFFAFCTRAAGCRLPVMSRRSILIGPRLLQVETVGDCYVVAAGLVEPDEEGFMQISPNLDPSDSAERLLQFAKGMMAHSRTVPVPRTAQHVTVRHIYSQFPQSPSDLSLSDLSLSDLSFSDLSYSDLSLSDLSHSLIPGLCLAPLFLRYELASTPAIV